VKLYAAVAQALHDLDVEILFGLMGDANMAYMGSWAEAGGETVHAVAEGGAVGMADGYARLSGRIGVVTVTHGPGLVNSLTALTEAVRAGSQVLVVTGDTASKRNQRQFIDIRAAASLTGADYRRVMRAQDVVDDIATAAAQILATRKPLVLDIPFDLLTQDVTYQAPAQPGERQRTSPDPEALDRALGIIASANRPIVLAGRGAVHSDCRDELIELARMIGAALATTMLGVDWFDGEDFNLGVFGTVSHQVAADAITRADCIIAFGASLNQDTTVSNEFLEGKRVVHCDDVFRHIGRYGRVDVGITGDARETARAMIEALKEADLPAKGFRAAELQQALIERDPASEFVDSSPAGTLDIRTACLALDAQLPANRIVVSDGGRFRGPVWNYISLDDPIDFQQTVNFGSIGLATAVALGASFARPDQVTVNATGDAGGAMAMHEFIVAVRHKLPFVFLMFNDGAYGAEYRRLSDYGLDPEFSLIAWPNFAETAEAFGGHGVTVTSLDDLTAAVEMINEKRFPLWIDIKVDPTIEIPREAW
jgi:acetolactate synthase-1/2/3 large subunit